MRDSKGKFIRGHNVPNEWRESYSKKNKGYKHTEESIEKIAFHSKGNNNPSWKGGKEGYFRRMARKKIGTFGKTGYRKTKSDGMNLIVHHKDGNVKNNKINNLEVMSRSEHTKLHWNQGDIRRTN